MERRQFFETAALTAAALSLKSEPAAAHPAISTLKPLTDQEPPPITDAERADRRAKAQRLMVSANVDALLVEPGPSLMYFSNIAWGRSERLFAMLLPQKGDAIFISPAFEEQRARTQIGDKFKVRVWQEDESPYALIASTMRDWGYATGTLAVESSARYFVPYALANLKPALKIVSGDPITQWCRGVKSPHEIELMRFANRVTIEAYRAAFQTMHAGMTQNELARNLSQAFQKLGYSGGGLVLFGESSAYPHGLDTPRPLQEGQIVLMDSGTTVQGYESDITRTVVFGTANDEQKRVFDIVRSAQDRALKAARPGVAAGSVDDAARSYITAQGFGPGYKYFTHRLGHGIGLEGHEWTYLVRGNPTLLREGMSFSDEPGIYQYGKFGVRCEDIMVITADGSEMLTQQARSLSPADI